MWATLDFIERQIGRLHRFIDVQQQTDNEITALIPTYEKEESLDVTLDSLLRQTRRINNILIVINGSGISDVSAKMAQTYAGCFPNIHVIRLHVPGKANALNEGYSCIRHDFPNTMMILGCDADVEADSHMVEHLEHDMKQWPLALGVRARYAFRKPDTNSNFSRSLVSGQRVEFAMTEVRAQLRGQHTSILGGQATLFSMKALDSIAKTMPNRLPWDASSKVEDAQLTRIGSRLGLEARVSLQARAWTGLMLHSYQWHSQRRKWQDGHFDDLTREFHPYQDRRRWRDQLVLGWNVILRVLFVSLAGADILTGNLSLSLWWLTPIVLAIIQSTLIAVRIPDRSFGEVFRALVFIPGEIYYLRTLSVWIESLVSLLLNLRSDGWKKQYKAESSSKHVNVSGWMVLTVSFSLPMIGLIFLLRYAPAVGSMVMTVGWRSLAFMTILSSLSMTFLILRIVRRFKEMRP
jgi:cellulose synthase/poly-beta-1,6-N-acetylglucosamine synthase-like glycosyltransferase